MAICVACMMEIRNQYRILIGKPQPMRHLEDSHGWDDNMKIDVREIGCDDVKLIHVVQNKIQ
jgi:hypothetical protein